MRGSIVVVKNWDVKSEYRLVRFEFGTVDGAQHMMRLTEVEALRLADALNTAAHQAIASDPRAQVP